MSIGTRFCCGVTEIYPYGEFSPIKGHGNMARKMGIYYDRIDIDSVNSKSNGVYISKKILEEKVLTVVDKIKKKSTCVLKNVVNDPFLENIL
jgi:hypothetical protein